MNIEVDDLNRIIENKTAKEVEFLVGEQEKLDRRGKLIQNLCATTFVVFLASLNFVYLCLISKNCLTPL
jgi:hypothetical protein